MLEWNNPQVACVALSLLGGHESLVSTEDVAVKCNALAPGRFQWRRYPEQISLDRVRHALNDAKKPVHGALVVGDNVRGWTLTEAGMAFCKGHAGALLQAELARDAGSPKERAWARHERERLLASTAFAKHGRGGSPTRRDAEAFFRVDDYVTGAARERKLVRILNTFGDDPDLGPVARAMAAIVRKEG